MTTHGRSTVVGVFRTREQARDAIDALKDAGFSSQDIGILMQDKDDTRAMAQDTGTSAGTGAATGAVGGGILGGLAGWLVGVGALAIPGVGPFIAAGALGTALAGAAIGAGVGAVAGALIGMGVPEEEAQWYEGEVRGGGTLVTVRSDTRHDEARRILKDHGAYDIQDRDAGTITSGTGTRGMGTADMDTTAAYDTTRGEMTGTGRWDDVRNDYSTHWRQRHGSTGGRFEDYEPGYRYGYEMSRDPRFRGRSFNDVEYDLRQDWNTRHGDKPWDRFSSHVREGWEGLTDRDRDRDTIQLREERLRVDKEREKAGEVNLRKDVVSEKQEVDVPVTREEVDIQRRRVDRPSDRPIGEDEEINVPLYEERVTTDKDTVVSEEIDVRKRPVRDTERVSDTVRREELRMDKEGDVNVGSGTGTTGKWDDMRSHFQSRWLQRFGPTSGRWEDYEPSYRYGYEMYNDPRYRGRSFSEVEPELRRDWETRYHDKPWDRFVDAIQDAWEGATRRGKAA